MFDKLRTQLEEAIKKIKGAYRFTESNLNPPLKEIRRALMAADVHYNIAKKVVQDLKKKLLGEKIELSVAPEHLVKKIMQDELTLLMGKEASPLQLRKKPSIVLVAGLQGAGKTTFVAKLAHKLKKEGKKVMLIAADIYRPGAVEQLKKLVQGSNIPVYVEEAEKEVIKIIERGVVEGNSQGAHVIILDTAGRQTVSAPLMQELQQIKKKVLPTETLLVVDGMTGQSAVTIAKRFDEAMDIDGVVLTKMDGDARGGAALSIWATINKPIKLLSTGERLHQLEIFHPDRMANRILGMGDIVSLVEEIKAVSDAAEEKVLRNKLKKNQFDFAFLQIQLQQIKKLGTLSSVVSKLPMLNQQVATAPLQEKILTDLSILIDSMTPFERVTPSCLDLDRKKRIAKGAGFSPIYVNKLLKKFEEMRKMMKKVQKDNGIMKRLFRQ